MNISQEINALEQIIKLFGSSKDCDTKALTQTIRRLKGIKRLMSDDFEERAFRLSKVKESDLVDFCENNFTVYTQNGLEGVLFS